MNKKRDYTGYNTWYNLFFYSLGTFIYSCINRFKTNAAFLTDQWYFGLKPKRRWF